MLVKEKPATTDTLPTRVSLLERVKNLQDRNSWREFYSRYETKVIGIARSRGLTEHDAEDVAQEVFKRVAKTIGDYKTSQQPGSFRSWLFKLTCWRATDQLRARRPFQPGTFRGETFSESGRTDRIPSIEDVPAPAEAERAVERESQRHLIDSLLKRVERRVSTQETTNLSDVGFGRSTGDQDRSVVWNNAVGSLCDKTSHDGKTARRDRATTTLSGLSFNGRAVSRPAPRGGLWQQLLLFLILNYCAGSVAELMAMSGWVEASQEYIEQ